MINRLYSDDRDLTFTGKRWYSKKHLVGFRDTTTQALGTIFWTDDRMKAFIEYRRSGSADPGVHKDFELENRLYELSSAETSDKTFPCPEGLQYRGTQLAGIEYALLVDNLLVADEMRLGKTLIPIGYINLVKCEKVLIVCPKSVKLNWYDELNHVS